MNLTRSLNKFSNLIGLLIFYTCSIFFFPIPYQCNGFFYSGEGVTIFELNRGSGRKEVFIYAGLSFLSSCGMKTETKTAVYETSEET